MTKDEIYKKAKKIISDREKETERIETCLKADLCPNCGEPGTPIRRKVDEIYKFECKFCYASYLKPAARGNEWRVILKSTMKNRK